jgi:hypothetical protein
LTHTIGLIEGTQVQIELVEAKDATRAYVEPNTANDSEILVCKMINCFLIG